MDMLVIFFTSVLNAINCFYLVIADNQTEVIPINTWQASHFINLTSAVTEFEESSTDLLNQSQSNISSKLNNITSSSGYQRNLSKQSFGSNWPIKNDVSDNNELENTVLNKGKSKQHFLASGDEIKSYQQNVETINKKMSNQIEINKNFQNILQQSAALKSDMDDPVADDLVAEHKLIRDIFKNYNKDIRPSEVSGHVTNVFLELSLFDILKLDTKNQILKTNSELILKWLDFHLKWDPEDYNNITILRVPFDKIWQPDVILYNTADSDYGAAILNTNAIVKNTGEIELVSHAIFVSVCNVDIQWYPFDEQHCKMTFAPWSYDEAQIRLVLGPADISDFQQNPEFYLEDFNAELMDSFNPCCKNPMSTIVFHVQLQRRTKFSLFFYIMPGILINLCAVMVFSLPAESGEKIGLGINSLLAMIVFLMAMTENLPPTEKIPLAGVYYGVCLSVITINITFSVFILNVNIAGKRMKTVPSWLMFWTVQLTKILRNKIPDVVKDKWGINQLRQIPHTTEVMMISEKDNQMMKKVNHDKANNFTDSIEDYGTLKDPFQRRTVYALELMARLSIQQEERLNKQRDQTNLETEWKFISRVLDRGLFVVFGVITFFFNISILTSSPYGEDFIYCPYGAGKCEGMNEEEIMALAYRIAKQSISGHNE